MRLNRGTLFLLGLSMIIIMAVLLFQQPIQTLLSPPTPTPTIQTLLPSDLAQQATQVRVEQQADFVQIDKIEGIWQVTDGTAIDNSRETNSEFVEGLLGLMSGFEYESRFPSDDLAQFGLDNPTVFIKVQTDEQLHVITLGRTNPDGDSVYVLFNDDPQVILMPTVFEFANIVKMVTEPPYRTLVAEATQEISDTLLFPDIFGYQITEFMIRDQRDGSFIRYQQGEQGTWIIDGSVVNEDREIDHVQAAINVSQFLFLDVEQASQSVRESVTNVSILTLSMTTNDDQSYTMDIFTVNDSGYIGILKDITEIGSYQLPIDTVNLFIDLVRQPPYTTGDS